MSPFGCHRRPATLRVDLESLAVQMVSGVQFVTSKYPVSRYRMENVERNSESF